MAKSEKVICRCNHCNVMLKVKKTMVGKPVNCPECGELTKFTVARRKTIDLSSTPRNENDANSPPNKWLVVIKTPVVCVALLYLPLLYWLFTKAAPAVLNQELSQQHKEVNNRTKEKLSLLGEFNGPKDICYRCEERTAVRYVAYARSISMGYCESCKQYEKVYKQATQPKTPAYKEFLRSKADIEAAGESETSKITQEFTGSLLPIGAWMIILGFWFFVGGACCISAPFEIHKRLYGLKEQVEGDVGRRPPEVQSDDDLSQMTEDELQKKFGFSKGTKIFNELRNG